MIAPRVLQVVLGLDPGGTERLVSELAMRLHQQMPTMVCCLDDEGLWSSDVESRGVKVEALHRQPGFHPSLGRDIARLARRHRATVIHAHHYSPFVYSCCTRVAGLRTPIVFTEHGRLSDATPSRKRRFVNQAFARCAARVFTVSEDVRAHLVAEAFSPRAVRVIYNGIDVATPVGGSTRAQLRCALRIPADALVLGTIARLDPVKDLHSLIRAAAVAAASIRLFLLVIGDGPERTALEAEAVRFGLRDRIRFLGHRDDARRWLAACDIYVNSSVSEGVSLTILEGMAASLPIVATRVGGTPEVVSEDCGVLVPPRDPAAFAAALGVLAADAGRRRALGRAGRQRVEHRFTLDRMIDEYATVYKELSGAA